MAIKEVEVDNQQPGPSHEDLEQIFVTGIGTQWPEGRFDAGDFEKYVLRWHDRDNPIIQKLLRVSRGTGIKTRTCFDLPAYEELNHPEPPSINVLDTFFRIHGTDLAVAACKRAIAEAQIATADITHTVAVTATNAGSPGYDLLVTRKLDISTAASRTLLHGVGCGGGLSAIRTAAEFVCAATSRRRPCNVLVFATEISSIQLRGELRHAVETGDFGIGPLIFGDGASALILTNRLALQKSDAQPILCLKDWAMTTVPETEALMSYLVDTGGFLLNLPKSMPDIIMKPVLPVFQSITRGLEMSSNPCDFDWALHPGGLKIIQGVQSVLGLPDHLLSATNTVYENLGNTSSVSVIAVIDEMRKSEPHIRDVIACSIGPGMFLEMAILRRLDYAL